MPDIIITIVTIGGNAIISRGTSTSRRGKYLPDAIGPPINITIFAIMSDFREISVFDRWVWVPTDDASARVKKIQSSAAFAFAFASTDRACGGGKEDGVACSDGSLSDNLELHFVGCDWLLVVVCEIMRVVNFLENNEVVRTDIKQGPWLILLLCYFALVVQSVTGTEKARKNPDSHKHYHKKSKISSTIGTSKSKFKTSLSAIYLSTYGRIV